jgi:hypothetical protein
VVNYLQSEEQAQDVLTQIHEITDGGLIKCDVSDESQVKNMMQEIVKLY